MPGRMNTAITIISGSLGIARNASTILMIKKTNPFKVARKKTERRPYNTRDERYEKGDE